MQSSGNHRHQIALWVSLTLTLSLLLCGCGGAEERAYPQFNRTGALDSIESIDSQSTPEQNPPSTNQSDDVWQSGTEPAAENDTGSSSATEPPTFSAQPIGGVCDDDTDCVSGFCFTEPWGGYCTFLCTEGGCPEGTTCMKVPYLAFNICYKNCETGEDCRSDQYCDADKLLCLPDCESNPCAEGLVCDSESGKCVPEGSICVEGLDLCNGLDDDCDGLTDEDSSAEICNGVDDDCDGLIDEGCGPTLSVPQGQGLIDLGKIPMGGETLSPEIKFEIPNLAYSFALIAQSENNSYIGLWSLTAPDGTVLTNLSDPLNSLTPSLPQIGIFTALVSNAPAKYMASPGIYRAVFYAEGEKNLGHSYVITRADPGTNELVIDLNLYFVGTPGLTASNYMSKNKFQSVLYNFWLVMEQVNAVEGTVNAYDITGSQAGKYTYLDMGEGLGELEELLILSVSNANSNALNFFFVQDINNYATASYPLGVAGGIPGPPFLQGTPASGVAVSLSSYYGNTGFNSSQGIIDTAETMAHEGCHQLGLFHTSERDGQNHDPLTDTPECSNDLNGDGFVSANECSSAGANNLMFWTVTGSAYLSEEQRKVLRSNPQLRLP